MQDMLNVAEGYPLYDTVVVCSELYGKEKSIPGWFTTFVDFADNERHTFFKGRTIGNSHLAYTNLDSADNVDFVYTMVSLGVRFIAPVCPDGINSTLESPTYLNENSIPWWLWDLPKHCGFDFRVQQDIIVENSCIAMPPGYGPRGGGGSQPEEFGATTDAPNTQAWRVTTGNNGEPVIDCRFPFPNPIKIPRNASIEANIYPSRYARYIMGQMDGPRDVVLLTEGQAQTPAAVTDYYDYPNRFAIQVSAFGYREVQQRGQYHAPGAALAARG